ncbi:unnamed protein product [Notodromas monacha]|uniref:Chitin-binding type-2 domain-containing protein n=1 Tax=Notodromas monacha TaxID=399045 RepID=A0A7R9BZ33_9CRUS|nr:unnamed protein product [Notodromas monacha]CAG0924394.1 unnamed protein product [Notodromas monacha]
MTLTPVPVIILCVLVAVAQCGHPYADFSDEFRPKRQQQPLNFGGGGGPQRRFNANNNRPGNQQRPGPFRQNFQPPQQQPLFDDDSGPFRPQQRQNINLERPKVAEGTNLQFPPMLKRAGGGNKNNNNNKANKPNNNRPQLRPQFEDNKPKYQQDEPEEDEYGPAINNKPPQPPVFEDEPEQEDSNYYDEEALESPPSPPPAVTETRQQQQNNNNEFRRSQAPARNKFSRPNDQLPVFEFDEDPIEAPPQRQNRPANKRVNRPPPPRQEEFIDEQEEASAGNAASSEKEDENKPDRQAILLQSTRFQCAGKKNGYYADEELKCEVFHYCQEGARSSWVCPEKARFHQVHLICMPEGDENICKMSSKYHFVNDYLYKPINEEEDGGTLQYSDRYYPEGYHAGANMELDGNVSPQVQQRKHNAQHKRPSSGTNQQRRRPAEYFEDPAEEAEEEEPNKFSFQQAPASPRRSQQKSQQLSSQQEFLRASQSRTKAGPSPVR